MKMHDYISLNLFSISSYIALALLLKAGIASKNIPDIQPVQYVMQSLADIVFMPFLIAAAVFLLFFVIEFFIRKKLKTEFFDINIENKTLRVIHVALFYIGAIILPPMFIISIFLYFIK
ncbi:TPA: hypothetical protein IAA68_01545 [Candidatus Galligastranaerophilus faecipullorum]|nr:hypothetical protein [Candidatus Galligastranaerophilus faecipullorum]